MSACAGEQHVPGGYGERKCSGLEALAFLLTGSRGKCTGRRRSSARAKQAVVSCDQLSASAMEDDAGEPCIADFICQQSATSGQEGFTG